MNEVLVNELQSKEYIAYMNKLRKGKRVFSQFVQSYARTFDSIETREEKQMLLHALQDAEDWGEKII